MNNIYLRTLKVSDTNGNSIKVRIAQKDLFMCITTDFIKEVELDNPSFAENGRIKIKCAKDKYIDAIEKLTSYLENLFLRSLRDENIDSSSSDGIERKGYISGGDKAINTERGDGRNKRERDNSRLYSSTRRDKPTEGSEEQDAINIEMD